MPTTTPNPAELAASIKSLAAKYAIALKDADLDAQFRAADELEAAIDQLRDLASGPSAGAVASARDLRWIAHAGTKVVPRQATNEMGDAGHRVLEGILKAGRGYAADVYYAMLDAAPNGLPAATPPARVEAPEALPVPLVMPRVKSVIWGSAAEGFAGRVWLELVDGGPHVGYRPAEARGALSDEKEVRAAAQTVITARLRFGWSPEVDEAIAVLEKALEGERT